MKSWAATRGIQVFEGLQTSLAVHAWEQFFPGVMHSATWELSAAQTWPVGQFASGQEPKVLVRVLRSVVGWASHGEF